MVSSRVRTNMYHSTHTGPNDVGSDVPETLRTYYEKREIAIETADAGEEISEAEEHGPGDDDAPASSSSGTKKSSSGKKHSKSTSTKGKKKSKSSKKGKLPKGFGSAGSGMIVPCCFVALEANLRCSGWFRRTSRRRERRNS